MMTELTEFTAPTGPAVRTRDLTMTVNGARRTAAAEDRTLLSDHLRRGLGLTGTHAGCEQGVCGACTVLVDDVPVRSCLMLAVQAEGRSVRTVEGLEDESNGELSPLQREFLDHHGLQCGFCTPGLLMSLAHAEEAGLTEQQVTTTVLPGHLCRCTGYGGIRAAVACHWKRRAASGDQEAGHE
ncbi:(2Fe-2S)-binding protein [Streptomyces sp. NPDC048278]|uniref:(2Fe-2S)-binding protein n=1 Tax=Streptomyces sp. NPDC048278 TaxID=3155809 RepID=UPI0034185B98